MRMRLVDPGNLDVELTAVMTMSDWRQVADAISKLGGNCHVAVQQFKNQIYDTANKASAQIGYSRREPDDENG